MSKTKIVFLTWLWVNISWHISIYGDRKLRKLSPFYDEKMKTATQWWSPLSFIKEYK